jgi:hypothetical protein
VGRLSAYAIAPSHAAIFRMTALFLALASTIDRPRHEALVLLWVQP